MVTCLAWAQSPYKEPHTSDQPPAHLVKFSYYDQGKYTQLDGNYIRLQLQDRVFTNAKMQEPFDVLLCIRNTSRRNVYIPLEVFCWFDSGFGSNKYYFSDSDTLMPGKTKQILIHVRNNWREHFHKDGYISLFTSDSTAFLYPIDLAVHFIKQDSLHQHSR